MLNLFFFAIIIRAIMSWFRPDHHHPMNIVLIQLTEPLLAPARRIIPSISGMDLSPIAVLILLQVISIFLNTWLI